LKRYGLCAFAIIDRHDFSLTETQSQAGAPDHAIVLKLERYCFSARMVQVGDSCRQRRSRPTPSLPRDETSARKKTTHGNIKSTRTGHHDDMKKAKPLQASMAARATLKPARAADAQLDHLEHMITAFSKSGDKSPLGCLDQAYWRKRLAALSDESDLVATQRARVIRLLDLIDQTAARQATTTQAAA
jgi:hypothetical protein